MAATIPALTSVPDKLDGTTIADAPSGLSRAQKQRWIACYRKALAIYPRKETWADYVSDRATWTRACHLDIAMRAAKENASPKLRGRPSTLPPPGRGLALLGHLLEVHVITPCGRIARHKFTGLPDLLWSPYCKFDSATGSLFCFPGIRAKSPKTCPHNVSKAIDAYIEWNDRNFVPEGCSRIRAPKTKMLAADPACAVIYRSDKFSKTGEMRDYIHIFDKNVFFMRSAPGQPPSLFMGGGKLKLTRDGLAN